MPPGSSQKKNRKSIRLNSGKPGGEGARASTQEDVDLHLQQEGDVFKALSTFEARSQTLSPDKRIPAKM
jgi:hypothetical protein